ncbi:uncharacterized protein TNCV_10221 [Trichonephila clavipes]|nr:uncharacterized protein TNCV_10221 [Trichonephila clavipes]
MVTIYISPNQSVEKIIEFIHKNLIVYTEARSILLNKLPIILSGGFDVDFSKDKSKPLADFLKSKFNLIISNDPKGTTFDGVFLDMKEGRIRSEHFPFRTRVLYRLRQKDRLRVMLGTNLHRYHTATYPHASDSVNKRSNDTIFVHVSSCVTLWVESSCVTA